MGAVLPTSKQRIAANKKAKAIATYKANEKRMLMDAGSSEKDAEVMAEAAAVEKAENFDQLEEETKN